MLVVADFTGLLAQKAGPERPASLVTGSFTIQPGVIAKGMVFPVVVNVVYEAGVTNLTGLSFDFTYSNTAVVDYVDTSFAGTIFAGYIKFVKADDKTGTVSIACAKTTGVEVAGDGIMVTIKLKTTLTAVVGTSVTFALTNIKATRSDGNIFTFPNPNPASAVISMGTIVWPGDTDNSGTVDQTDLLPIGTNWLLTNGGARKSWGLTWAANPDTAWTPTAATYADANGDHTVNQADVLAIGLNWKKSATAGSFSVHPLEPQMMEPQLSLAGALGGTPALRPVAPKSVSLGSEFSVDVVVGDQSNPVSSLFGIAYVLDFASSRNALQVLEVAPGSFLGSDIIFFPQTDNNLGTVSFGISRKAGQAGVSGTGAVARVKFKILSPIAGAEFSTREIAANNQYGTPIQVIPAKSSTVVTAVDDGSALPLECALRQNYPNPFNPRTALSYQLSNKILVTLKVLDVLGREVTTLVNDVREPGVYTVQWNASHLPSGIYIGLLKAGSFTESRRMVLLK